MVVRRRSASNWDDWQDQRMRIAISAGVDSVSHSPAHFPRRSCKEQDYPSTARTVSTGTAGDTFIATIAATDIDGDTLTYSLTGPDADAFDELFAFNTATGEVRVKEGVTVDHRYWSRFRYSVRVNVTDGEDEFGNAESQATIDDSFDLRINISNGNLPGTITPTTDSPVVGRPHDHHRFRSQRAHRRSLPFMGYGTFADWAVHPLCSKISPPIPLWRRTWGST